MCWSIIANVSKQKREKVSLAITEDQKSISLEAALPHETPWSAGTSAADELVVEEELEEVDDDDVVDVADASGLFGFERDTPSWKGESERWILDGV